MTPVRQHIYPERVECPLLCDGQPRFLRRNGTLRIYECQHCALEFSVAPIPPKCQPKTLPFATRNAPAILTDEHKGHDGKPVAPTDQRITSPLPPERGGAS
jgi:hypothetical protein